MFPDAAPAEAERWIRKAADKLTDTLYDGNRWTADYRRLRIIAIKK